MEARDFVRLNALVRYEAHLDRQARRAMKDLRELQLDRIYGGPEGAPHSDAAFAVARSPNLALSWGQGLPSAYPVSIR